VTLLKSDYAKHKGKGREEEQDKGRGLTTMYKINKREG